MKNVTMSSEYGYWVGSNIVDGNYNRNVSTCKPACCAVTNNAFTIKVEPWIQIDLGETNTFTRIVLYGGTGDDSERRKLNNNVFEPFHEKTNIMDSA